MSDEEIVREIKEPYQRLKYIKTMSDKFPKRELEVDVLGDFDEKELNTRITKLVGLVERNINDKIPQASNDAMIR